MLQSVVTAIARNEMSTKIREASRARGRSDRSLAAATNMTPVTYNRKIQGVNYEFTTTELLAIAAELEMNPLDLLPSAFFTDASSNVAAVHLAPAPPVAVAPAA